MRAAALALVLWGCASAPMLPAPGQWERASLPAGVLAEADLEGRRVLWDPSLLDYPSPLVSAAVLHEACHLRGFVSEDAADCCAARLYAALYEDAAVPAVVSAWLDLGELRRAEVWLECAQ